MGSVLPTQGSHNIVEASDVAVVLENLPHQKKVGDCYAKWLEEQRRYFASRVVVMYARLVLNIGRPLGVCRLILVGSGVKVA